MRLQWWLVRGQNPSSPVFHRAQESLERVSIPELRRASSMYLLRNYSIAYCRWPMSSLAVRRLHLPALWRKEPSRDRFWRWKVQYWDGLRMPAAETVQREHLSDGLRGIRADGLNN